MEKNLSEQQQQKNEWEGEWLTDLGYLVTINSDGFIHKAITEDGEILTGHLFSEFVSPEGISFMYGKLMHRRRGDEDLRKKWKTNKQ